jgi:hypothetical protein
MHTQFKYENTDSLEEEHIKMVVKEKGYQCTESINVDQDMEHIRALLNTVMKFRVT